MLSRGRVHHGWSWDLSFSINRRAHRTRSLESSQQLCVPSGSSSELSLHLFEPPSFPAAAWSRCFCQTPWVVRKMGEIRWTKMRWKGANVLQMDRGAFKHLWLALALLFSIIILVHPSLCLTSVCKAFLHVPRDSRGPCFWAGLGWERSVSAVLADLGHPVLLISQSFTDWILTPSTPRSFFRTIFFPGKPSTKIKSSPPSC